MQPLWIAIYNNNEVLREYTNGIHNNYYDIDKDNLVQFRLACSSEAILKMNCVTGELYVNKTKVSNNTLDSIINKGLSYGKGLIQFKEGKVFASARGITDEILVSANLGYKIEYNSNLYQFILSHDYQDYKTYLEVKVTDTTNKTIVEQTRIEL